MNNILIPLEEGRKRNPRKFPNLNIESFPCQNVGKIYIRYTLLLNAAEHLKDLSLLLVIGRLPKGQKMDQLSQGVLID